MGPAHPSKHALGPTAPSSIRWDGQKVVEAGDPQNAPDRPTASAHAEGDAADLRPVVCLGQDREAGGVEEGDPIQVHDHARAGPWQNAQQGRSKRWSGDGVDVPGGRHDHLGTVARRHHRHSEEVVGDEAADVCVGGLVTRMNRVHVGTDLSTSAGREALRRRHG